MNKEIADKLHQALELRQSLNKDMAQDMSESEKRLYEDVIAAEKSLLDSLKRINQEVEVPAENVQRIELRNYLQSYANGKPVVGAEAEMNQGLGLNDMTQIPLEALLDLEVEERTDDPTNLTQGTFNKQVRPIAPRLFHRTDAAWIGVAMPSVPAGTQVYPVMTGGTSASMRNVNQAVEADAATFTTTTLNPTRLSARYKFNLEGVAELGTILESTLRSDLRQVMGDALDDQILKGDGNAPNVSGFFNALANPAAATAEEVWTDYRNLPIDAIDGLMARNEGDVRFLFGKDTYQHARKTFAVASVTSAENQDAIQAMQALGASVRSSFRVPAVAGKKQDALRILRGARAVAPVWQGITIIRDPYTGAASAQVAMTAHMLFSFGFPRTEGWARINLQVQS